MVRLFVLCVKSILHHNQIAFEKGHVYICAKTDNNYMLTSEDDSHEAFPKDYFDAHFEVIFPVMDHDNELR